MEEIYEGKMEEGVQMVVYRFSVLLQRELHMLPMIRFSS